MTTENAIVLAEENTQPTALEKICTDYTAVADQCAKELIQILQEKYHIWPGAAECIESEWCMRLALAKVCAYYFECDCIGENEVALYCNGFSSILQNLINAKQGIEVC